MSSTGGSITIGVLATSAANSLNRLNRDLHLLVAEHDRAEHDVFGQTAGLRLDHQHGLLGAGDDQVQIAVRIDSGHRLVEQVFAVLVADPCRANGTVERGTGDGKRGGDAEHGRHLGVDRRVQRLDRGDDLHLAAEALGEQRPDGPVDQARGQDLAFARAALTTEKAAGDAAGGVGLFLVVDGERQEIFDLGGAFVDDHGHQQHGVVDIDHHGPVGLAGDLASLQGHGLVAELKLFADGSH